jgi:hypothetical protein
MQAANITSVDHHMCSLCGYMTKYVVGDDGELWFDSGCYCSSGGWRSSSYQDAANWINMQPGTEGRKRLMAKFGLP